MPQKAVHLPAKEEAEKTRSDEGAPEELLDSLKSLQDDVGQICELASEETRVVEVFFESFLKLMQPFAKTMSVSLGALPEELGDVAQANIDPTGHLMILHQDGQVELRDLREEAHRDLMVSVVKDVVPKFKELVNAHRRKIEDRIEFLLSVTNEMQKISKAFSTATT